MSEYREIIEQVFCEVFEQMAFMFGDPVDSEELMTDADEFLVVKMDFHGDLHGEVEMVMEKDLCAEIASNVLGVDVDDEKAHELGTDAAKEMLNVICGQALTEIAGSEPIFNLTVPEIKDVSARKWKKMVADKDYVCFVLDDHPALCRLVLKS